MAEFGTKIIDGKEALVRPGSTPLNRVVARVFEKLPSGTITFEEVMSRVEVSLRDLVDLGAQVKYIDKTRSIISEKLSVSNDPAALEIWLVEVLWGKQRELPDVYVYNSGPGAKIPSAILHQTGVDHAVSHIYHWVAGQDFSEVTAGADQVKLMWIRGGVKNKLAASAIFAGYIAHKHESPLKLFKNVLSAKY